MGQHDLGLGSVTPAGKPNDISAVEMHIIFRLRAMSSESPTKSQLSVEALLVRISLCISIADLLHDHATGV